MAWRPPRPIKRQLLPGSYSLDRDVSSWLYHRTNLHTQLWRERPCRLHFEFLPCQPCLRAASLRSPARSMRHLSASRLRSLKPPRALPKPCNGEAEVGDGAHPSSEDLSQGQSSAERLLTPPMARAITARRQSRTVLLPVTRLLTACNSTDPTIRAAGRISAMTGFVILV